MLKYRGVKSVEIAGQTKNIPLNDYVSGIEQDLLKEYLAKAEIATFSVQETDDIAALEGNSLYELLVDVDIEGQYYGLTFVLQVEGKIRDAFHKMVNVYGVNPEEVKYVKPYGSDLDDDKLEYIVTQLQGEVGTVTEDVKKDKKKQEKYLDSKNMSVLRTQIDELIEESNTLQNLCEEYPSISTKKLKEISGDLLKYKRSSNTAKLIEYYQDALKEVESIRSEYLDAQEQGEVEELKDSISTNMGVVREYKKFEKVSKVKVIEKLGSSTKFSQSELYFYKIFGKYGIHMKVIGKEVLSTLKEKFQIIPSILNDIELLLILVIIEYLMVISFKFLTGEFTSDPSQINAIYYILLQVGVLGISISAWKWLGHTSLQRGMVSLALVGFTYLFIRYFISVNLAL